MKIKNDIEFISFSDGVCDIYSIDEEENESIKYANLGFSNKVLGFNRYYTAAAQQIKVNRVINIPQILNINTHDILKIKGIGEYDIELIQHIYDTNPQSISLTLKQLEMFGVIE